MVFETPTQGKAFEEFLKRRNLIDQRKAEYSGEFDGYISETVTESHARKFPEKPWEQVNYDSDGNREKPIETYEDSVGVTRRRVRLPWDCPGGVKPTSYEEHVNYYDYGLPEDTMVEIYTREMWDAAPPAAVVPMGEDRPIMRVNCFYTGSPPCFNKQECRRVIKELQTYFMEKRGLEDIPYSFLIGPDGNVYEGRGYEVRPSKVHKLYEYRNSPVDSLDVAYIGPYYQDPPRLLDAEYQPRKYWPKKSFLWPMHTAFLNIMKNAEQNEYLDDDFSFRTEVYV